MSPNPYRFDRGSLPSLIKVHALEIAEPKVTGGDRGAQFFHNLAQFPQFLPNFGQNRNFSANPAIFSAIFPIFGKFSANFSAIFENSPKAWRNFFGERNFGQGVKKFENSKNSQNVKPKIFLQS